MRIVLLALLLAAAPGARAADGTITVVSAHDVKTTVDKMQAALEGKGMKIFLRVDHAAGAASVGKRLRPTELLVFGNPRLGSALMACAQTVGLDLPMKALVFEDAQGGVRLTYNDPAYLKRRHDMPGCDQPIANASAALANFARAATR